MKKLIQASAAALAITAFTALPSESQAYSIFNPSQFYWIYSDGYSLVATFNQWDWQLWDTGYYWGEFFYMYFEEFTNQWTRHWLYDYESGYWTYCHTVNFQNFN